MKNLNETVRSLKKHNMFIVLDNNLLLKLKNTNVLKGYRNDGTGSRLMAYVNLVRIAKKLKKNYIFYWDTRSDKFAKSWPNNVTASENISKYLPNMKNIKLYNSRDHKISQPYIIEWKFLMMKNEKEKDVMKQCIKILKNVLKNNKVQKKTNKKFKHGLHIRCGGISATSGLATKKTNKIYFYKEEFNLGKWYPKEIWAKIVSNIKDKSIIVSDDYKYVKKNIRPKKNFLYGSQNIKKNSELFNFLDDIFKVSMAENVICGIKTGAGLVMMLASNGKFYTPEKFLKIEEIFLSFSNIIEKNFYKFNRLQSLVDHNIRYFSSKPIDKFKKFKEVLKKSL